jgi:CheY-like chemotaxis protein
MEEPVLLFLDINMPVMDGWGLLDIKTILRVKLRSMVTSSVDRADKRKSHTLSYDN